MSAFLKCVPRILEVVCSLQALEPIQPDPRETLGIVYSLVGRTWDGFPVSLFPALNPT